MVWFNEVDPTTGNYVDPDNLRVEIIDESGVVHPGIHCTTMAAWKFWRRGFHFDALPLAQRTLTLLVTPLDTYQSVRIEIRNPQAAAVPWFGK